MYKRRHFRMDPNMKENCLKTEDKEKEFTIIKMGICTWETGKMINSTAREFIYSLREIDMRVN